MSVNWKRPADELPENNARCVLIAKSDGSIHGPIGYKGNKAASQPGMWLDLFATAEAGEVVFPADVSWWALWGDLGIPGKAT